MDPANNIVMEDLCFIGGGQMAEALIKGILSQGIIPKERIYCAEPLEQRRIYLEETYGIKTFQNNNEAASNARNILLAVKPQVMESVLTELRQVVNKDHLIISIAAGVKLSTLEGLLGEGIRIIRVMPNTPALVQAGAAALARGSAATEEDMSMALGLFEAVGVAVEVPESLMDGVTGLSGSGPAYCFLFIEALIQAGIREGLARPIASKLAIQTVLGSAKMCLETGRHPQELVSMVTSPGGTTIEGIYQLERAGMNGIVMDAVRAATLRSRELGGQK